MRAFWLPSKAPSSKVVLDKPDMATLCPASGEKLKLKVGWEGQGLGRWPRGAGRLLLGRASARAQGAWDGWFVVERAGARAAVLPHGRAVMGPAPPHILLRLQDLVAVRFLPVPDGAPHEYMDPVTKDAFTNASRLIVIKPTGAC